jgi:hypothetical protein
MNWLRMGAMVGLCKPSGFIKIMEPSDQLSKYNCSRMFVYRRVSLLVLQSESTFIYCEERDRESTVLFLTSRYYNYFTRFFSFSV